MSSLLLVALLAISPASVRADESSAPSPELIFLEKTLIQKRDDKAKGVVTAEQHQSFLAKFRPELVQTLERLPPAPANVAAHSRILVLLGDHAAAIEGLARALEAAPDDTTLSLAIAQTYYERADYAAALATAESILRRDPKNDAALFLKHSSMGRVAANAETRAAADAQAPASRAARADIVFAPPAKKRAAPEIPRISNDEPAPKDGKPLPLWPLLPVAGLGAGAYAVAKSRRAVESEDGFNADDRPEPGELQRFVAGSILSGLAAAALYLGGGYVLSVGAPLASRFMSGPGQQVVRLAQSEAGALNPGAIAQTREAPTEAGVVAARVVARWGPTSSRGPLPANITETFRSGSYTEALLEKELILYRVYGGGSQQLGAYWTKTPPTGPLQSTIDSALNPAWGNTAQRIIKIRVPTGTRIFEGHAASQGGLVGGGSQVYLEPAAVQSSWIIH